MDELDRFSAHLIQNNHVSISTTKRYCAVIKKYKHNLTSVFLIPYIHNLLQEGKYKADSLNSGIINAIRAWGHFTHNEDLLLIKKLPVPKNEVSRSILSVEEIHQLLDMPCKYTPQKWWDTYTFIFEILSRCAFRPITLLRVKVYMLNFGLNTFDLSGTITKTGKPASIPIPRELIAKLKKQVADKQPNDYLFPNSKGKMIDRNKLTSHFAKRVKRLGIKRYVTLYSLRHSAACRMLHNSNILTTKGFLTHTSLESTEKYIHLDIQDIADAMDRDELVKGNMPIPEIFKQIINFVKNIVAGDKRLKVEVQETEDELIIRVKKNKQ